MGASCWTGRSERGALCLARLMLALARRLGARAGRWLLPPLAWYFLLTDHVARRASRQFLNRALGHPARWRDLYRHFHQFGMVLLDRVCLLQGDDSGFRIEQSGLDVLDRLHAQGGLILLGAHLGSFEVLRMLASRRELPVRPLMYRRNAGGIARLLENLRPGWADRIIDIGAPDAMLRVAESLQQKQIVGMLADRTPAGERCVMVDFLGAPAPFPAGPLLVAVVLKAPVVVCHAVCIGPRHYHVSFESLQEEPASGRADRDAALERRVAHYAAWLETLCRKHPYNWFNFYDFWQPADRNLAAGIGADGASPQLGGV